MNSLKSQRRSIKRIAYRAFKTVGEIFTAAPNSTYKAKDLTRALIETCIRNSSAEQCSMPSPDTMLRRLHQVDEETLNQIIWKSNAWLLKELQLPKRVILAIDCRDLPYYGVEQVGLIYNPKLPGTRTGIMFATLSIVEKGRTFTLATRQVGQSGPRVKIIEKMLKTIRGLAEPRIILMDRGFFTVEVIKTLKSRKMHFIMPAKRTAPIERLCKSFERGELPPVVDYTTKGDKDSVRVKLILVRRKTKEGWKTYAFVSDATFEPEVASELYRCRWRIETNNREVGKFRGRTTSRNMKLRRIYYSLAALLYNLWIVMRSVLGVLRSYEFKNILDIQLNAAPLPGMFKCGLGPPP